MQAFIVLVFSNNLIEWQYFLFMTQRIQLHIGVTKDCIKCYKIWFSSNQQVQNFLILLRNKSAYHYNWNNPFDHNTVSNRCIYTLNKQIWPFTLVHSFKFKNFSRSMCASLDKYLLRSFNYISSREIKEILFLL